MGMFDTVKVQCPKCGHINSVQSKAGPCDLKEYPSYRVPLEIAGDLDGEESRCDECGAEFVLRVPFETVALFVELKGKEHENEG